MDVVAAVAVTVGGIVIGNLLLNGIRGNKKVSDDAFRLFVEEVRANFLNINQRLSKIEDLLSFRGVLCRQPQKDSGD